MLDCPSLCPVPRPPATAPHRSGRIKQMQVFYFKGSTLNIVLMGLSKLLSEGEVLLAWAL